MKRGKIALVTGATSGIGAATARALAASGVCVLLLGRNPGKLAAAARGIRAPRLLGTAHADLRSLEDIDALLQELARRLPRLDVLVHCAGEYGWTRAGRADPEDFARLFDVNVRAPFLLTQRLLPQLARAQGQVIFLNSSVIRGAGEGVALYKATQHAVQGFTDSLRQDLNRRGIRVSSLYPGRTATPRMRRIYAHEGRAYKPRALLSAAQVAQLVVMLTTLPRQVELTDVHVRAARPY